jgi:hypothetical protein
LNFASLLLRDQMFLCSTNIFREQINSCLASSTVFMRGSRCFDDSRDELNQRLSLSGIWFINGPWYRPEGIISGPDQLWFEPKNSGLFLGLKDLVEKGNTKLSIVTKSYRKTTYFTLTLWKDYRFYVGYITELQNFFGRFYLTTEFFRHLALLYTLKKD